MVTRNERLHVPTIEWLDVVCVEDKTGLLLLFTLVVMESQIVCPEKCCARHTENTTCNQIFSYLLQR